MSSGRSSRNAILVMVSQVVRKLTLVAIDLDRNKQTNRLETDYYFITGDDKSLKLSLDPDRKFSLNPPLWFSNKYTCCGAFSEGYRDNKSKHFHKNAPHVLIYKAINPSTFGSVIVSVCRQVCHK